MTREADLETATRRFGEAWAKGDEAALGALLSPSYTHVDFHGRRMDRAAWLDQVRTRRGNQARVTVRDLSTRHLGDVAVIRGINDLEAIGDAPAQGRESRSVHFTQVWAWQDGRWQRELFHATLADSARQA